MSAYNVKAHPGFAGYNTGARDAEFGGLIGLYTKFSTWRRARRAYNETFFELESLSNRDLADIGVTRSDIPALALDAAETARRS